MHQQFVGRDEPILEPDLPIVDAHHHLFLRPTLRYLLDDYLADATAGHRIVASVYSETSAFSRPDGEPLMRPVGEVEFANGMGAMAASGLLGPTRVCAAIVGHADMRLGDDVGRLLDRCMQTAPERYRGVRQILLDHDSPLPWAYVAVRPPRGLMPTPAFHDAFRHLGPRGLIFDAAVFDHQLADICAIADAFPDTGITLNHAGMAMGMSVEGPEARAALFATWRQRLAEAAERPNITCKVGGFGLPFWGFCLEHRTDPIGYRELADLWRPWIETAIELFGPDRCMAESNYPPDGRAGGYVPIWNALKSVMAGLSADEKADLFWRTATRVHRIDLPPALTSALARRRDAPPCHVTRCGRWR